MKHALLALSLMLFAIAFGITGAIWVGIRLGGWGLAVMVGVALGTLFALPLLMLVARRTDGGNPAGAAFDGNPGWALERSVKEGFTPGSGYGSGFPVREWPGAPLGAPFLGMPWVSWIAWIPGLYPTSPGAGRSGWPPLPPTPRTFTVIGEDEEE